MATAPIDGNDIKGLIAASNVDGITPVRVYADPLSHRLLVDTASGTGTVTDVSVVTTNGFAGTVANSTTTPAITLSTTVTGILSGNGTAISAASTTGSGAVVLANTPTLITPNIGAAAGTTLTTTGLITTNLGLQLKETGAGSDLITIVAPSSIAAGYTLTLPVDDGTPNQVLSTDGSGVLSWAVAGTGTVTASGGSLTSNAVVLGNGTTDIKVSTGITTNGTAQLVLGVNTTTIGTVKMFGNTSGDVTLTPTAVAGTATVQTLPATTGTLANRVTTANGVSASNTDGAFSFTLGAITPTTVNGNTLTTGSSTYTGTAGQTYTFPTTTATIARTDAAQTFTGAQTYSNAVIYTNNAIAASSNAATVPVTARVNTVTNDSAATLTITLTTASAVSGQLTMVRILDFSAVAQTLVFVNTENSTVSVPATSNGSTTLPLTVGFQYNSGTSKWRCIALA